MDLQEAKVVGLWEVDHLGMADLGVDLLQKDLEQEGPVVDHHQKGQVEDLVVDLHQKDPEEEGQVVDHHQKDQGLEGKGEGKERGKEDEESELSLLYMK